MLILTLQSIYLYSAGKNYRGQLGLNVSESNIFSFQSFNSGFDSKLIQVVQGEQHVIALTQDGTLYGWGDNELRQVSNRNISQYASPVKLIDFQDLQFVQIAAGTFHSVAMAQNGSVFSWGFNLNKQLGTHLANSSIIDPNEYNNQTVKGIYAAGNATFILTTLGDVYFFGQCEQNICRQSQNQQLKTQNTNKLNISNIKQIFAFNDSTFFIDMQGNLYSVGNNNKNKLCHNTSNQMINNITIISGINNVSAITSTGEYTVMLANGQVYACGQNYYTINGSEIQFDVPTQIIMPEPIVDITACIYGTIYVTKDKVLSIGTSMYGELGYKGIKRKFEQSSIQGASKVTCSQDFSIIYNIEEAVAHKLSSVALGFICFGVFAAALLLILLIFYIVYKQKRNKRNLYNNSETNQLFSTL